MGVYGKIQVVVLVFVLVSARALADGPAALHNYSKDGTPAWLDNPQFMDCGLKCLYLQSVEKISIRSRHTLETLNQMKNADTQDKMDQIIPGMCDWRGGETVSACQIRWFKVQIPTLYQDKLAIRYNTSSVAQLENGHVPAVVDANGVATVDPSRPIQRGKPGLFLNAVPSDYAARTPIVTTMEHYSDIRERAIANSHNDPRLRQANVLAQQIEKTIGVSREEFVRVKHILKDPSDPKAGTYAVVQTNKDGTPQYNLDAYNKAVRNREKLLTLDADEMKRLRANLQNLGDLHRQQLYKGNAKHEEIYKKVRTSILGAGRRGLEKFKQIPKTPPKAPPTAQGPKPASQGLARAVTGPGGASSDNVSKDSGNQGEDQDIKVPATPANGSRPYFTVGYSDNVLGQEINSIEDDLAKMRNNMTLER